MASLLFSSPDALSGPVWTLIIAQARGPIAGGLIPPGLRAAETGEMELPVSGSTSSGGDQ
jgi:hypothetical protein